jgi:hypothetical protein
MYTKRNNHTSNDSLTGLFLHDGEERREISNKYTELLSTAIDTLILDKITDIKRCDM